MSRVGQNRETVAADLPGEGGAPICPHCEAEIEGVCREQLAENLGKAGMWFCTSLKNVLGSLTEKASGWVDQPHSSVCLA